MFINLFNDGCSNRLFEKEAALKSIRGNKANYDCTLVRKKDGTWIEVNFIEEVR